MALKKEQCVKYSKKNNYLKLFYWSFENIKLIGTYTEMHGGKSVWNSLAVPATVKSELHPVKSAVEWRPGKV